MLIFGSLEDNVPKLKSIHTEIHRFDNALNVESIRLNVSDSLERGTTLQDFLEFQCVH